MPRTETICFPMTNELSFEEVAVITRMASYPEADNCTAEKMHSFFSGSSYDEVKAVLEGLRLNGYLNKKADVYSLNRSNLPKMVTQTFSY